MCYVGWNCLTVYAILGRTFPPAHPPAKTSRKGLQKFPLSLREKLSFACVFCILYTLTLLCEVAHCRHCEASVHCSIAGTSDDGNRGFSRMALRGRLIIHPLAIIFGCLGVLSMLQGWHSDTPVYGEGPSYDRPSSGIPGSHEDGQTRQARRRERERHRRAAESRSVWVQCPPLLSSIPHGRL